MLFSLSSVHANRDTITTVTYATNLLSPYTMKVNTKNLACGTTQEYSWNIFDILWVTPWEWLTCIKQSWKLKCMKVLPNWGSPSWTNPGSVKLSATNKQILQELGLPSSVYQQVGGDYQQYFDFQMWLITDESGWNTGTPFSMPFWEFSLLAWDNTIIYSDASECKKEPEVKCGSATKTFSYNDTNWDASTLFCFDGTSDPIKPAFPSVWWSTSWECSNGSEKVSCKASRGNASADPSCGTANQVQFDHSASSWWATTLCGKWTPTSVNFPIPWEKVAWQCISGSNTVDCSASRDTYFSENKEPPILESVEIDGCTEDASGKYFCMSNTNNLVINVKLRYLGTYSTPAKSDKIILDINNESNSASVANMFDDTDILDTKVHQQEYLGNAKINFTKVWKYTLEVFALWDAKITASKSNIVTLHLEIIPNNTFIFKDPTYSKLAVKWIFNSTSYEKIKICGKITDSNDNKLLDLGRTVLVTLIWDGIDVNIIDSGWQGEALKITNPIFDSTKDSKYCFDLWSYSPWKDNFDFNIKVNKHTNTYTLDPTNYSSKDITTQSLEFKKPLVGQMQSSFDGGASRGKQIQLGKSTLYKILPNESVNYSLNYEGANVSNVFTSHVDLVFEKTPEVNIPNFSAVLLRKKTSGNNALDTGIEVLDSQTSNKTPLIISYTLSGKSIKYKFSSTDAYNSLEPIKLVNLLNNPVLVSTGVAVTWLINQNDSFTTTSKGTKASIKIGENLTRYDLLKTFKQNVGKNAWLVKWCKWPLTITDINSDDLSSCTVTVNGEKISYIQGNVTLGNGVDTLEVQENLKRTIIVKDGFTYIKSNISTYKKNKATFLIGTYTEMWLKNFSVPEGLSFDISTQQNLSWWTFVNPSVTNIDAFVVSEWPLVSYDSKLYVTDVRKATIDLPYQLHIYGSLLSLNTNGGTENLGNTFTCPYIITNCTSQNNYASIFDLVFLRQWTKTSTSPQLRPVTDPDYKEFPLFIERNPSWNSSPSVMFVK